MSVLLARHRYIICRLAEAFEYPDEEEIEAMMRMPEVLQSIDYFFTADGPTKVVITEDTYVIAAYKQDKNRSEPQIQQIGKCLKVHMKDVDLLPTTAVYFMKVKRGKDNDDHYAIDPTKINDGALSFGVVRAPLESLDAIVRCVYRPMITEMGAETWGESSSEQRNEFLISLDIFSRGLQASIRSLSGGLELKKPDDRIEGLGLAAVSDSALVIKSINLLHEWCRNIENYLDDSDRSRWETPDSGPDTELNYWRSRMQRYSFRTPLNIPFFSISLLYIFFPFFLHPSAFCAIHLLITHIYIYTSNIFSQE